MRTSSQGYEIHFCIISLLRIDHPIPFVGNPAEYTLILEDDTFAADDFVPKIFDAIDTLTERKVQNWALLKLWYSKDFMGWENLDIFLLAFIGGTVFAISRYILAHMVGVRNEKLVNYSSIYCGLLFLGILIFIGKQNLSMDQKGVFETLANCCSPAHVYPQKVIQPLIDYVTSPIRVRSFIFSLFSFFSFIVLIILMPISY